MYRVIASCNGIDDIQLFWNSVDVLAIGIGIFFLVLFCYLFGFLVIILNVCNYVFVLKQGMHCP